MKRRKFRIGEKVQVMNEVVFVRSGDRRIFRKILLSKTCIGVIVGVVHRSTGRVEYSGYDPGYLIHDPGYLIHDLGYLIHEKTHLLWEVKLGYLNKPILAFEEDIEPLLTDIIYPLDYEEIPWFYTLPLSNKERERLASEMREEVRNIPRDSKGRWLKWTATGWVDKNGTVVKPLNEDSNKEVK